MAQAKNRSERIRDLNDKFRRDLVSGRRVFCTAGVNALGSRSIAKALVLVRAFKDFTSENDPHGEHDFGIVRLTDDAGVEHTLYWKIDYYDLAMQFGSEDAADPKRTLRVLTIMLREEY